MKRILVAIPLILLLTLAFAGCLGGGEQGTRAPLPSTPAQTTAPTTTPATCLVRVEASQHYNILTGKDGLTVPYGGTASFRIAAIDEYELTFSAGVYDPDKKTLTVEGVTSDMLITVSAELPADAYCTVTLIGDGFTAEGGRVISVPRGEDLTLRLTPDAGKEIAYASVGTWDATRGELFLKNVRSHTEIEIAVGSGARHSVSVVNGAASLSGTASLADASRLPLATDSTRGYFLCWTVGGTLESGGRFLSSVPTYLMPVTEDCTVYANYTASHKENHSYFLYYLNGGAASGAPTYLKSVDTSFYTAPNARWDDGSFTRAGYALLEYNTKPDGSGTAYGLGSKIDLSGAVTPLYCIWAPVTSSSAFTTSGTSELTITGYTGTAATVVIPETIGGKPVTAIAAGAFRDESFTTLFITRNIKTVAAGAAVGCSRLDTLYFSDSVLTIPDDAFDGETYTNFKHFYVNAVTAPRHADTYDGGYRVKWDRLMKGKDGNMIVFISGSSSLHGVATKYLEALLDGEYTVVNYGTVRTTNNMVYMEAVANFVDEGDIVIYAPENSIYQFGESDLTYKTFRDLEGSLNVWRYVDISNYDKIFSSYTTYRASRADKAFDYSMTHPNIDAMGDEVREGRDQYAIESKFSHPDTHRGDFWITFDERVKPTTENLSSPDDTLWTSLTEHAEYVKSVVKKIEATGARCYFGFGSVNREALTAEARTEAQQEAFVKLISETFDIDVLGKPSSHVFDWKYMLPDGGSDFHLNDYGRPINTYHFYLELCAELGITPKAMKALGTNFDGCIFE